MVSWCWCHTWLARAPANPNTAAPGQAYLADAYSYWTQHVNMEGTFDLRYLVRRLPAMQLLMWSCGPPFGMTGR